jgi:hypothetical protein
MSKINDLAHEVSIILPVNARFGRQASAVTRRSDPVRPVRGSFVANSPYAGLQHARFARLCFDLYISRHANVKRMAVTRANTRYGCGMTRHWVVNLALDLHRPELASRLDSAHVNVPSSQLTRVGKFTRKHDHAPQSQARGRSFRSWPPFG